MSALEPGTCPDACGHCHCHAYSDAECVCGNFDTDPRKRPDMHGARGDARKRHAEATTPDDHRTHIPAVVLDLLASDAAREAVAQTLINEGAAPGNSIHSWRCEYPDQYGPCNCVKAVADAALAAVRDTLGGGEG